MKKEEFIKKINNLGLGKYVFVKPNNYVSRSFSFGCFFDSNQWIAYETDERGKPEDIIRTISENECFECLYEYMISKLMEEVKNE